MRFPPLFFVFLVCAGEMVDYPHMESKTARTLQSVARQ
jgi:hypothetical protein